MIKKAFPVSERSIIKDYTVGNPMKQLIIFSLPFIASNVLQQAYSLADTIIVGRYLGSPGLTAASNASNIIMIFLLTCIGFCSAGQIIISQHIGAGNRDRLGATIGTMLTFSFFMGVAFMIIPFVFARQLLTAMHIPAEAFDGAMDYVRVCSVGNLIMCIYNAVSSTLRGMGDSRHPMIFIMISSILNVILDVLFVGPMGMGCFGAALATVISQFISCLCSLIFMYWRRDAIGFDWKPASFRPDAKETRLLFKLGIPIMIQSVAVTVSMMIIHSWVNMYGLTAAAVGAVGTKISMVAGIGGHALNAAGSTMVGQNFAAGKYKRVTVTLGCILVIGCAFSAVISLLVVAFPEQIFGLFNSDPEVLKMCHMYVPITCIDALGFATRAVAFAFINGIGFSTLSFIGGITDGIVCRIGFALLLQVALGMGLFGLWLGNALAGNVFILVGGIYYLSGRWKKRKSLVA